MVEQSLGLVQQQRMEQSLTPQMMQSLKILQAPILDLQTMIRSEMDQNPTLEREAPEVEQSVDFESQACNEMRDDTSDIGELTELAEWDEDFRMNREVPSQASDEKYQYMMDSIANTESLQQHLLSQLATSNLTEHERNIAEVLIGNVDDDGYLQLDLSVLTGSSPDFPEEMLERIMGEIQSFEPAGVCARSLKECLLIQLSHQKKSDSLEALIVREHLDELGAHQYDKIAASAKLPLQTVMELSDAISLLDPKPGRNFTAERTEYIIPEIEIKKEDGKWIAIQNKSPYPRLFISPKYIQLLQDKNTAPDTRKYIREKIAKSKFFIRSIDQRQSTILRIANEIIRIQEDFFEQGVVGLKPLTMKQIADILEVHETTISRACNGKYAATPHGTFEFRYFFTTGVAQSDGTFLSNAAIKNALAEIIKNEDKTKPFSDQRLSEELSKRNIRVARRTVAKYREQLKILPARLRKVGR